MKVTIQMDAQIEQYFSVVRKLTSGHLSVGLDSSLVIAGSGFDSRSSVNFFFQA